MKATSDNQGDALRDTHTAEATGIRCLDFDSKRLGCNDRHAPGHGAIIDTAGPGENRAIGQKSHQTTLPQCSSEKNLILDRGNMLLQSDSIQRLGGDRFDQNFRQALEQ